MDLLKNIAAAIMVGVSWIGALSVQDTITFILASVATIVGIIFVLYGIRNRRLEYQIKRQQLNELQNGE